MNDISEMRLLEAWRHCERHLHHLIHALWAIRNTFAHDYPQDDALKAAFLNEAVAAVPVFEKLLARVSPVIERIR